VRSPLLPDVPTTAELGMPDVEADNWYGLVVPAATPPAIAAKLQAAAVEALHSAEVKDKYLSQGGIAGGNSTEEFTAYVKSETDRWGKVITAAGIKIK
jgi:tripartite-type tricarboxylate transporter receptor subunit TctC